ncbi:hypothetical protein AQUCO_04200066v1 [Aquilegia coerulea]|uniref:Protein kinase domain-containing protein n=1 Tax=Aquilegia coerulea TaxID=218851 RepID=A0A2G5CP69_AQUCA|nr:hypothetical protein AQUCO_04200066v1 [Aquilegia coerulea]
MAIAALGQLNLDELPSWGSRSFDNFDKLEKIGEGTYGEVFMARETKTGEVTALKKIMMDNEREGFPITAIREIKILKKLQHDNVVKLKEIVTSPGNCGNKYKGSIYMVFEYMDHDLAGLSGRPGICFTVPQIKCYMRQLLTGLHYCHVNQVLHRDIKGSNLLVDNKGILKLADFGLARSFSSDHNGNLTNRVITLWYRPPELLLGTTKYGPAVDMWSVGCIFAELLDGKAILQGKTEAEQVNKIFELCGAPDELNWPGVSKLPWYNNFKPPNSMKRRVRDKFKHFDRHALELLERMLTLDPSQRISAKDALDAEYFWNDPLPCDPKRQRKSANSNGNMKKLQSDRSYMIHSMHTALPSRLGTCVHSSDLDQTSHPITSNLLWLRDLATITESPGDLLEDQAGTHQVEILVEDTILVVEVIVEITVVVHTPLKGEELHIPQVVCLVKVPEAEVVVMESVPQIIPKAGYTELQMGVEAQI